MSGYIGTQPVPQATQTRDVFTATSGQTSFATSGYTPNFLDVWLNGVKLVNGDDFTATNGSDVVLTSGATAGDTVEVLSYSTYEVNAQTYTGGLTVNNDAATVLTVDRATSDGSILDIKKDGATVGSIGANNGQAYLAGTVSGVRLASVNLQPADNTGASTNGVNDLGGTAARWKDLYLSGGVYLGGTGADNYLDDYEYGTWTPSMSAYEGTPTTWGEYFKIGRFVTASFSIALDGVTADGSAWRIANLPFNWDSTVSGAWGGYISKQDTGLTWLSLQIVTTNDVLIYNENGGTKSYNALGIGCTIRGAVSYVTT